MFRIFAILFLLASVGFALFETYRMVLSWSAAWIGQQTIYFADGDTKILLLWAVILLAFISYFVWPSSFRAQPEISKGQVIMIALAVSGLLSFQKIVFGGDYLKTAEAYGYAHHYVLCDEDRYKYFGELKMSKDRSDCL